MFKPEIMLLFVFVPVIMYTLLWVVLAQLETTDKMEAIKHDFNLKLRLVMNTLEQFQEQISQIDAATNEIAENTARVADELEALKTQLSGAGLSSELESEVLAKLTASATSLKTASDNLKSVGAPAVPADPLPEPTPEEPTPTEEPTVEGE
jgi:hypothetical protein